MKAISETFLVVTIIIFQYVLIKETAVQSFGIVVRNHRAIQIAAACPRDWPWAVRSRKTRWLASGEKILPISMRQIIMHPRFEELRKWILPQHAGRRAPKVARSR